VSDARLLLGQNGISTTVNDTDYDWLFDNSFNTTDSEKKLKAKINLQSTMEADISNITGVTKASVTINLPESTSSIYDTDENATVSIMITTSSDYDSESTQGIAEYARGCVGSADTDNITIIDNNGTLLFSGTNSSTSVSNNLLVEQQVEEYYNSKLWNLMVNSGVYDEVSVSSNLDVNISDSQVKNVEYYSNDDDDTGPKESYYYYLAKNTDGTGGVVGTDANGEEITDYDLLDTSNGESTLNLIKETYNTSYTETVSVEPVGQVDMANSSMAMYLTKYDIYNEEDLEESGELEGTTFTEYEASHSDVTENINPEDLVAMLSKATGIKEASIYVVERTVPIFYPAEEKSVPVQSIISILLAILIIALLIFVVFKGMKPEEQVEVEPELSVEALLATTKENQTLDDIEFSDKSATRVQIEKFVDENPEAVATLLRNWLNEDWE
jgi:flagellar M-ring protein FliF